jgi:hypothetical protein
LATTARPTGKLLPPSLLASSIRHGTTVKNLVIHAACRWSPVERTATSAGQRVSLRRGSRAKSQPDASVIPQDRSRRPARRRRSSLSGISNGRPQLRIQTPFSLTRRVNPKQHRRGNSTWVIPQFVIGMKSKRGAILSESQIFPLVCCCLAVRNDRNRPFSAIDSTREEPSGPPTVNQARR